MSWTGTAGGQQSKMFRAFLADALGNAAQFNLSTDPSKVALYTDAVTPDNDVASSATAYNAGVWVTGNEQFEAGQWAQGGIALTTVTLNSGTADIVFWSAANAVSGSAADLTGVVGCLVYDDFLTAPVADPGICFNFFGGANSVVNGTFSVIWNSLGIWRATL